VTTWICGSLKCQFSGRDKEDGYPVCKHPDANKDATLEIESERCFPAQLSMGSCPNNLWRFSGCKRIPVNQSSLIEYGGIT
jgi:hypothetical protein